MHIIRKMKIKNYEMFLLWLLFLWKIQALTDNRFNLYNTENSRDRYCLLYYTFTDKQSYVGLHHLTSYCFRSSEGDTYLDYIDDNDRGHGVKWLFTDLEQQNVTSDMLLQWSAPMNTVEEYQIFLNNNSNLTSTDKFAFYNCTPPWFGPFCQFKPTIGTNEGFKALIKHAFADKKPIINGAQVTYYEHLVCQTYLSCLDWREICDGKSDCIDGLDEKDCWQLEISQCNTNEYRCENGQCIPIEFFLDDVIYTDCFDGTDERIGRGSDEECNTLPTFLCEETACPEGNYDFPCGNGACTQGIGICRYGICPTNGEPCRNGRSMRLSGDFCSNAVFCMYKGLQTDNDTHWCNDSCPNRDCLGETCMEIFEYRRIAPIFGHIRLMIANNKTRIYDNLPPIYICYNGSLCPNNMFPSTEFINDFTCIFITQLNLRTGMETKHLSAVVNDIKREFRVCLSTIDTSRCNHSTMYQCQNSSKCISKQRLLDGIQDCFLNDDETYKESCTLPDIHQRFRCKDEEGDKCFTLKMVQGSSFNCKYREDESYEDAQIMSHIYFSLICDGINDLLPIFLDIENETDETNCEHWLCNNTYTRCDELWACKNGADEIGCRPSSICSHNEHECVFPNDTSKLSCLSLARHGDGVADCVGETDERAKYKRKTNINAVLYFFKCWNSTDIISFFDVCNTKQNCMFKDDESFCTHVDPDSICFSQPENMTDVEKFFCYFSNIFPFINRHYFKLKDTSNNPSHITYDTLLSNYSSSMIQPSSTNMQTKIIFSNEDAWFCNQGVPIYSRTKNISNPETKLCLCPPSYYGDQCRYQNQRVSLTVQIRAPLDSRITLIFLLTLIDSERNIQAYDFIEYISIRDCIDKFNIYLLYSTRPKNSSEFYSVQIDAFNQKTMTYRASWIFPLRHLFLPVQHLVVLLKTPFLPVISVDEECSLPCIHGQCFHYVNDPNSTFCQCESGWSGIQCNIQHDNECAYGAYSISKSICLCPVGRFGSRCYLSQTVCHSNSCLNGGECVPTDVRYAVTASIKSKCICPEGYLGSRCDVQEKLTRIEISFHHRVSIPQMLFIHFITAPVENSITPHQRVPTAKKIQFDQDSVIVSTAVAFHIAIVQIPKEYYLIAIQEREIENAQISTKVQPSHRCLSIGELFDDTFAKQHLLKRIKYYHVPCQQRHDLVCFYDDVHICLCNRYHEANCFEFNHSMTYTCGSDNYCEHGANCFQDHLICPRTILCACELCYFGSRCQFTTKGATLVLDTILGYHIRSNRSLTQQPLIIKLSALFTSLFVAFGLLNSFLTYQTFRSRQTHNVGCGLYLLTSSFISFIAIILLTLKFIIFLCSQIGSISNRSFLGFHCLSMDYCIRVILSINEWLSACVAIERAVNILQGVKFNKKKSKQIAKWAVASVVLIVSCSYIHEPIHRRLIEDEEEQRTWCVTQYSSTIQIFDGILTICHFIIPFIINCISALIVILISARTRSNTQKQTSFKGHLRAQLIHHKHLLISPIFLIILALPRLIISFLSGCMKSSRDPWLYLIGYFLSFISSIMTFVVFVLPSDMYKKEFEKSIKRFFRSTRLN